MSDCELRQFFEDVRAGLHINLGQFCDRNKIYRYDFTNFMKSKKYWTSLYDLNQMRLDIINCCRSFMDLYDNFA